MRKRVSLFRKLSSVVLTLAMVAGLGSGYIPKASAPVEKVQAATTPQYRNVMYYGEWSIYAGQKNYTPDKIPGNYMTHLNFAFLDVDADGNVISCDTWADFENPNVGYSATSGDPWAGVAPAFIQLRNQYPNMKIGFSVGGWTRSGDFPKVAASSTARKNFAENIAKAVHLYGYDFVDIDWEYPTADRDPDPTGNGVTVDKGCKGSAADTQNFTLLLQELRDALDKYGAMDDKHYELSVAMSASPAMMAKIEYDKVLNIVDFANMMTYDLCGAWAPYTGHQTALYTNPAYDQVNQPDCQYSVDACIRYLYDTYGNSIDASKIVVGIAPYTRGWGGVQNDGRDSNNPGLFATAEPNSIKAADGTTSGTFAYSDIGTLISQYGLQEYYDETAEAAYYYSPSGGYFFTCDNARSVTAKAKYVKNETGYKNPFNKPLGGLISWMASLDAAGAITKTSHDALYGEGTTLPAQEIEFPGMNNMQATVTASGSDYTITIKNNNTVSTSKTQGTMSGAAEANVLYYAETFAGTATYPKYYIKTTDNANLTGSAWAAGGSISYENGYTVVTMTAWPYYLGPGETATLTLTDPSGTASVSKISEISMTKRANTSAPEVAWTNLYGNSSEAPEVTTAAQTTTSATQTTTSATQTTEATQTTTVAQTTTAAAATGNYPEWSDASVAYEVGDLVQYEGKVYEVIIKHTSNWGWPPNGGGSSLFKERTDLVAGSGSGSGSGSEDPSEAETETEYNYTNPTDLPQHMVTGYWHNFCNGSANLKLSDVPTTYDMVCVAFANSSTVEGRLTFDIDTDLSTALGGYTKADFINDIKTLKSRGQHVIISVGGAEGRTTVTSQASADEFASSLISMVNEYGFEGVDIDFEGAAIYQSNINYLASALRKVHAEFGDKFIITMAPETYYMHDASDITGAYFNLAMEIKDILTICYPQFYNAGGDIGYGGFNARYQSVSFVTSLATMYIENGLRPDQLAIGLPSMSSAASSGYMSNSDITTAINSLVYGTAADGFTPPKAYPTLRGVMTWSINWDATNGYSWANAMASLMDTLPTVDVPEETTTVEETTTQQVTTEAPAQPTEVIGLALQSQTDSSATFAWGQTTSQITSGQTYKVYIDNSLYGTYDGAATVTAPLTVGTHTIKVTAVLNGYETSGSTISVTIVASDDAGAIDVVGFQISTANKGVRTVYSVNSEIGGKDVVSSGVIYSIKGKADESEIKIGSTNSYVKPYTSTSTGLMPTVIIPSDGNSADYADAKTYAMTMKFGSETVTAYTGEYVIKVFAELSDGSYVYSDAYTYSVYSIADTLYQNNMMSSYSGHQFLYDNILTKVDSAYKEVDYDWGNTMAK